MIEGERLLRDLISRFPGSTAEELADRLNAESGRRVRPIQVLATLRRVGPDVTERSGRYWLDGAPAGETGGRPVAGRARALIFDLESVVRQIATEPYLEPHVYQIGATRMSRDTEWMGVPAQTFVAWTDLPAVAEPLLGSARARETWEANRRPVGPVLDEFIALCEGATHLVAYNGTSLDFPVIDALLARHGRALPAGIARVDGLYLAQALWPVPPNDHRLHTLLERLRVDVGELFWHDARDDARALGLLLLAGARTVREWPDELRDLVRSAGAGSAPWELLFDLFPRRPERRTFGDAEVRRIVAAALTKPPVRAAQPAQAPAADQATLWLDDGERPGTRPARVAAGPRARLVLPDDLLDETGRVDVFKLAQTAKPESAKPRPAQARMVEAMREWIDEGRPALVEAPTGTGKSYAMLAVALDWLAADDGHRVVISTFTKSLQSQLADDIERIGGVVPGLLDMTDVVKGSANRLSLRGLLVALADLAAPAAAERIRGRPDYTDDARYRDLVLYLFLRFLAEGSRASEEWLAHSVDVVDVPPMFEDYIGDRKRNLYLAQLSQAQSGELGMRAGDIALHTATVSQALDENRLIIANHALLLAHLDAFEELGDGTLLLVDEAHSLEAAATQALSAQAATPEIWRLARDVADWLRDVPTATRGPRHRAVGDALGLLEDFLRAEGLQQGARRAFETVDADGLGSAGHARRTIVGSRLTGPLEAFEMAALKDALRGVAAHLERVDGALGDVPEPGDPFERDRFLTLRTRAREISSALVLVGWDLYDLDRDHLASPAPPTAAPDDHDPIALAADAAAGLDPAPGEAAPEEHRPRRRPAVDDGPSNQLVWLEEIPSDRPLTSVADLRFRVWSSPIELARDPFYRAFRSRFPRTYYISATLRVGHDAAAAFDFTRERLALSAETVGEIALDSPFDAAAQARLVVFDDFPSWAEQTEAATRTVAHQLARYGAEMLRPDPLGELEGLMNGAMVLTTSRSAASEIGAHLVRLRALTGYPLALAEILGARRAIEQFAADGGILLGTKGLWQGVDIAEARRLRLVWINKLPFPSFEDPLIKTRRALVAMRAREQGLDDPDGLSNARYYLPLAAIDLRQAVGRLLRTTDHRGVIVISDRKLAGPTRLRRLYRDIFLGSLDPGLLVADPETSELTAGNITSMAEGWRRIWSFFAGAGLLDPARAAALSTDAALEEHTQLPETLRIRRLRLTPEAEAELRAQGGSVFADELVRRSAEIGGLLDFRDEALPLREQQEAAIRAVAAGKDLLAVLPTGYGKSFVFQLPALATSGVTIVVSPLVSLMTDQALELNRAIGGAVRALVAPMRESNSRTGKVEVQQQLEGTRDHGIRLVYMSPERLCSRQFQDWVRRGVERGTVRRIAIDEAHTFVTWADDFRPSFRRAERFLRELKAAHPEIGLLALTATATTTVRNGLRRSIFGLPEIPAGAPAPIDPPSFAYVVANPLRDNLALWSRGLGPNEGGPVGEANVVLSVVSRLDRHAIVYCLTVRQAVAVHNLIVNALGEAARGRVLLYHGRLPDTAKAVVANAFRQAPRYDPAEPGEYEPLIVVATSAFGLGINRADVRTVFCVSPATDLAGLYQQVGRAGRDHDPASGLMLASNRSFRTLRFMATRDTSARRIGFVLAELLKERSWLSTRAAAREVLAQELSQPDRDRLREDELARREDDIHTLVVRVLAELSRAGVLEDRGDFPGRVSLLRGTLEPDTIEYQALLTDLWAAVSDQTAQSVIELYERLSPSYGAELPDPGAMWSLLLTLHAEGYLEVSQMIEGRVADRGPITGIARTAVPVPTDLVPRLNARQAALFDEVARVGTFFSQSGVCVNSRFGDYFGAHPAANCCADPAVRCSACWNTAMGAVDPEPELFAAFFRPPVAFTNQADFRRRELRDLPALIEALLRFRRAGLAPNLIGAVLRGSSHYMSRDRVRRPLWPALVENRFFGRLPTLRPGELDGALAELAAAGRIIREGGFWRHPDAVASDAADADRRARRRAAALSRGAARAGAAPLDLGLGA